MEEAVFDQIELLGSSVAQVNGGFDNFVQHRLEALGLRNRPQDFADRTKLILEAVVPANKLLGVERLSHVHEADSTRARTSYATTGRPNPFSSSSPTSCASTSSSTAA